MKTLLSLTSLFLIFTSELLSAKFEYCKGCFCYLDKLVGTIDTRGNGSYTLSLVMYQ